MNWFPSDLLSAGIVGVVLVMAGLVLIVVSFVRVGIRKPKRGLLLPGLIGLIGGVCLVWLVVVHVSVSPPDIQETVCQKPPLVSSPVRQDAPSFKRLRMTWDSESTANWPVAETLAMMSEVAYLPPVEAELSFSRMGLERAKPFLSGSTVGYVASHEDMAVVVFRGTDNLANWLVNLDCLTSNTPHGAIHKGFYSSYQSMKSQITTLVGQAKPKHLWITGHSLGGALALVCGYDFLENKTFAVDGVITFGQPMVACEELARYMDRLLLKRYAHFVNDKDIVPRVPLSPYSHSRSLVWFTENGVRRSKPLSEQWIATSHGAKEWSPLPKDGHHPLSKEPLGKMKELSPPRDDGPPPLSKEQFEKLKIELKASQSGGPSLDKAPAEKMAADLWKHQSRSSPLDKAQFEKMETELWGNMNPMNMPQLQEHSMSLYLEKIRAYLKTSNSKPEL